MTLSDLLDDISCEQENTNDNDIRIKNTPEGDLLEQGAFNVSRETLDAVLTSPVRKTRAQYYAERIMCPICNKEYRRGNVTAHRKTQVHQALLDVHWKLASKIFKD